MTHQFFMPAISQQNCLYLVCDMLRYTFKYLYIILKSNKHKVKPLSLSMTALQSTET